MISPNEQIGAAPCGAVKPLRFFKASVISWSAAGEPDREELIIEAHCAYCALRGLTASLARRGATIGEMLFKEVHDASGN